MDRDLALKVLHEYVKKPNMIKHCLASEAVMQALAEKINADTKKYAFAGLLHDLDVEITSPYDHGLKTLELLKPYNVDSDILEAIMLHNEKASTIPRTKTFHFALASAETITGLITATALVYPDKKLSSVKVKSITKRMKEKAFAQNVSRENILECEKIGLSIEVFTELSLEAMKKISDNLDL